MTALAVPAGVDGVDAALDPSDGTWELGVGEAAFTLRPWTWGERLRLIEACSGPWGLDRDRFVDGMLSLLVAPAVPPESRPAVACAVLRLLGVREGDRPDPLIRTEARLAREFAWLPADMDRQPADALDRLVLAGRASTGGGAWGGTTIVVEP